MRLSRFLPIVLAVAGLCACASAPNRPYQVDLPDRLGMPLAVLELEVSAAALQEGETAQFDIEFEIDLHGRVRHSSLRSASRPDLAASASGSMRSPRAPILARRAPSRRSSTSRSRGTPARCRCRSRPPS
jgi:hypothetical protein